MSEDQPVGESVPEIKLTPVGFVQNGIKEPSLFAETNDLAGRRDLIERARATRKEVSTVVINEELEDILDGIEEFSHLLVLYWPHRVSSEQRSLIRAHPMGRQEFPLVGIFATRSPVRPNPILVTTVRLLERRGNLLMVEGLDAVDGSPVVDIKPDIPGYRAKGELKMPDWMVQISREFGEDS